MLQWIVAEWSPEREWELLDRNGTCPVNDLISPLNTILERENWGRTGQILVNNSRSEKCSSTPTAQAFSSRGRIYHDDGCHVFRLSLPLYSAPQIPDGGSSLISYCCIRNQRNCSSILWSRVLDQATENSTWDSRVLIILYKIIRVHQRGAWNWP